jgi:ribosome recycling factor
MADELQKMTDENVHEIDQVLAAKEQEIMHV